MADRADSAGRDREPPRYAEVGHLGLKYAKRTDRRHFVHHVIEQLKSEGYAIIRGFLPPAEVAAVSAEADRIYAEGLKHHATYRDRNLLFEVLDDPKAKRRVVLQAHWTAWISPLMEEMRRSPHYYAVLEPFLGRDIKQISHQIHWKPPGAKYTSYRFHQDARFREGNVKDFG